MKKVAYLKCPTGIAGDMCLSALLDVGVPWLYLRDSLANLGLSAEYELTQARVYRGSQIATKVEVNLTRDSNSDSSHSAQKHQHQHNHHHHHHGTRHLPEINKIIQSAQIPVRVKEWSLAVFQQLAIAEGAVHGIKPEEVHFHEVGATDAIIDIVGTCLGFDWLEVEELYCSALPTGGGMIKAAHGKLSVPVPAVLELWKKRKIPVYSNGIEKELVTPTGAAIATTLASHFGSPPAMKIEKIGFGAGTLELPIPNLLQLWIGHQTEFDLNSDGGINSRKSPNPINPKQINLEQEQIVVLETQIDDLNPQIIAYTLEQLLLAGALDVFTQGITMKKSRSGILLSVICHPKLAATCKQIIFRETTTLGIRERSQTRSILNRQILAVDTLYGVINLKIASWEQDSERREVNVQPEYEDCAKLARKHNIPWQTVHQEAINSWQNLKNESQPD